MSKKTNNLEQLAAEGADIKASKDKQEESLNVAIAPLKKRGKKQSTKQNALLYLEKSYIDRLDALAEEFETSRSLMLNDMLERMLPIFEEQAGLK